MTDAGATSGSGGGTLRHIAYPKPKTWGRGEELDLDNNLFEYRACESKRIGFPMQQSSRIYSKVVSQGYSKRVTRDDLIRLAYRSEDSLYQTRCYVTTGAEAVDSPAKRFEIFFSVTSPISDACTDTETLNDCPVIIICPCSSSPK